MNTRHLIMRSLRHYMRTGIMVAFGVAVASSVIVGSLVIGDSVSGSIRDTALARLGNIDHALIAPHFFRQELANDLARDSHLAGKVKNVVPLVITSGSAANPMTEALVPNSGVVGVNDSFWKLWPQKLSLRQRAAAVSESLARDLGVKVGDSILVNIDKQSAVPSGTLFAHRSREDTLRSLRLEVSAVLPDKGAGGFKLDPGTDTQRNVFVSQEWLLSEIGKEGKANALLVESGDGSSQIASDLKSALASNCTLADHGLKLVPNPTHGYLSLQSDGMLLRNSQVDIARKAAEECDANAALTSVYLATTIKKKGAAEGVPYSILATTEAEANPKSVCLNAWAANDISAKVGDELEIDYLVSSPDGTYHEAKTTLTLAGIVNIAGPAADQGVVPRFEGITDAQSIDEWNAPFPIDLDRIRPKDEAYWNTYRATPKAFVSLDTVRRMWGSADWVTSIRLQPRGIDLSPNPSPMQGGEISLLRLTSPPTSPRRGEGSNSPSRNGRGLGGRLDALQTSFSRTTLAKTHPEDSGMVFRPVRQQAVAASKGTTDFGGLFLAMSFFLVIAGAGLAGTLMRLSADRRASETGIMMACGFDSRVAGRVVMGEGICLTVIGVIIGVPLGVLYAWGVIAALRSWWIGAVGTSALWVHLNAASVLIGAISGLIVGVVSVAWGVRGLTRSKVLDLLAGWQAMSVLPKSSKNARARIVLIGSLALSVAILVFSTVSKAVPPQAAFFGCGALLLIASLAGANVALTMALSGKFRPISTAMLALRSAAANRSRSLLVIGLIASASFMIVAVAANTRDFSRADFTQKASGTGGFALRAISSLPIHYDFGTPKGREALGFPPEDDALFKGVKVYRLLMSPGDDVSCLNLAKPTQPRLLGVSPEMIQRGGFNVTAQNRTKPWVGLNMPPLLGERAGVRAHSLASSIPIFGDADSVEWTLHSGIGKSIKLTGENGNASDARFAGLIHGSIFAGEILMSEENLKRLFPSVTDPRYFLIETPAGTAEKVSKSLRANLGDMGLEVRSTREVLNSYMAVQNTYMSVFLALGGLGLLLGTVGLVAVLLRGALERRREFALMLATGSTKSDISRLLMLENSGLLLYGLICGTFSALVAVAPHIASAQSKIGWSMIVVTLAAISAVGLTSCALAAKYVVNGALVQALREE